MGYFRHSTTGPLEVFVFKSKTSERSLRYKVIYLSSELEQTLPFDGPRLRFVGEIEDQAVDLAWQPDGKGRHYAMLNPALCRSLGLALGDEVTLRFNVAANDEVPLDDDLKRALDSSRKRQTLWNKLTKGRQRGLAYFFASAKTQATRSKRLALIFDELERGVIEKTGPKRARMRAAKR